MNPEDVKLIVDQIFQTGSFLATKAFQMALRQVFAASVMDIFTLILCLLVLLILVKKLREKDKDGYYELDDEDTRTWYYFATAIFIVICLVEIYCLIGYAINPEWYALQKLLTTIHQLR